MYKTQISEFMEARPARTTIWAGPQSRQEQADYLNVIRFVGECRQGRRHLQDFQEALTLTDFPKLFTDLLSRELLAMYEGYEKSWPAYFKQGTAPDYRNVRRLALDGAESPLNVVPPNTEIDRAELEETNYEYAVEDRGRAIDIPVQVFVNNDLDSFNDIPDRLLKASIRSEEQFAAQILCDSSGPNVAHFGDGTNSTPNNANLISKGLTVEGVQDAITALISQKDTEGNPIYVAGYTIVIPPQLKIQCQRILSGLEVRSTSASVADGGNKSGGNAVMQLLSPTMPGENSLIMSVNSYIPLIATTNGATTWFLIANPATSRPAGEMIFRPGLTAPRVAMKRSDVVPTSGYSEGSAEMQASFDRNTISLRVMHTFGGGFLDPRAAQGSTGTT